MEKIKVQYLIGFSTAAPFCKSQKTFLNLFNSLEDTIIESSTRIKYKDIYVNYKIRTIDKNDEKIKYFDLSLTINDEKNIEKFVMFLSSLKKILMSIAFTAIETIWNDVGLFYSQKSYPLIYEIENLMRMLITKFMILKVGLDWTKQNVPEEVKKSLRTDSKNVKANYLYEVDFIQLSHFLFKKYSDKNINDMYKQIEEASAKLDKEDLSTFIPKSNWFRYFSELVDCDDNYILKRWERLYELRCKIAHNIHINKNDFDVIFSLSSEIKIKLEQAIEKLSEISITKEEKEEISVNFAKSKNVNAEDFLYSYNQILNNISKLVKPSDFQKETKYKNSYIDIIKFAKNSNNSIPYSLIEKVNDIHQFRNRLVHSYNSDFESEEILLKIIESENIVNEVLRIRSEEEKNKEKLHDQKMTDRDDIEIIYQDKNQEDKDQEDKDQVDKDQVDKDQEDKDQEDKDQEDKDQDKVQKEKL